MDVTPAFRGSEAIASGRLTRGQLRGPGYLSLFRDVYVRAGQRLDLEARSRASTLFLPSGGALAGHSAAALWRAGCSPAEADVEFAVPGGTVRAQPGLVVHRGALDADEVTMRSGVPVTTPLRTAYDLGRRPPRVEAVVCLDALARAGRFAPADVMALAARHPGARGNQRLPEVVRLSNPAAESAGETRCRLALVLRGLPEPQVQYRIRDRDGRVVLRVDLAYPLQKLAIEYDGRPPYKPALDDSTLRRDEIGIALGWTMLHCGSDATHVRADQFAENVARRLGLR
jgi:hypothetical protein